MFDLAFTEWVEEDLRDASIQGLAFPNFLATWSKQNENLKGLFLKLDWKSKKTLQMCSETLFGRKKSCEIDLFY